MNSELFSPEEAKTKQAPWKKWGPCLSERQWGTVREDYSEGGDAWNCFPHDHARSRAYRWGEDGLAGITDERQRLCFALSMWNGRDPNLKERLFGLTNPEATTARTSRSTTSTWRKPLARPVSSSPGVRTVAKTGSQRAPAGC